MGFGLFKMEMFRDVEKPLFKTQEGLDEDGIYGAMTKIAVEETLYTSVVSFEQFSNIMKIASEDNRKLGYCQHDSVLSYSDNYSLGKPQDTFM